MMNTFSPKGQFSGPVMPTFILSIASLSLGAKVVYSVLAACAQNGKDYCFPSQTYLAKSIGVSLRSVQNYLRELEAQGLIISKVARLGSVLRYYFVKSEVVQIRSKNNPATPEGYAKYAGGYAKSSPVYNKDNNTYTPLPPKGEQVPPQELHDGGAALAAFEKVWGIWPRKQDRKNALFVWHDLFRKGTLPHPDLLLSKIDHLMKFDRAWQRGMVSCLSTWLKGERWNDEPTNLPSTPAQPVVGKTPENTTRSTLTHEEAEAFLERMKQESRKKTKELLAARGQIALFPQHLKEALAHA